MILPDGIKGELYADCEKLSEKYGVSIVIINNINWNDDISPWPAEGVFKKAKPFGGKAAIFLNTLTKEIIPNVEKSLGINDAERTILGVSLSGLFSLWAGFNTNAFTNIICISGSLWYDGFTNWLSENTLSLSVKRICMLLGEKEKLTREKRISTVEERTAYSAELLRKRSNANISFQLVEGTHFSPITPRLEKGFEIIFGTNKQQVID